ncbi:MAG TPA: PilN domain-containing protein [Stellaceae bacterium]|nr:PilN domain-containing protein [Stellaceae bacterium]
MLGALLSPPAGFAMRFSLTSFLPAFHAAWRWWSGEIVALVPARWREALASGRERLVLATGEDGSAALIRRGGGKEELLARLDLDPAQAAAARETLAALRPRLRGATTVLLPADCALRAVVSLPLAAEANLAQVVGFELDRHTPFRSEEVYRSQQVLRRDAATKRLAVRLTVVPRPLIDAVLAAAQRLGLTLDGVEVAGEPRSGNLLPAQPQALGARLPSLALGGLALLAAVLTAGAVLIPLQRAHRAADALAAELAEAKGGAEESLRLQKEIDAEIQESGFLEARKRQAPSASEVLYTLTHLLPDDTWLSELELAGGELRITGFAASASSVLALVDQSARFGNAAFRSPVTQDQRTQREQFNIAARLLREAKP